MLVVILIGIIPIIISDAEHLVLVAMWVLCFFFSVKGMRKIDLETGFLKVSCVWNSFFAIPSLDLS